MTPPTPPAIPSSNYVDTFHGVADAGAELTPELARAFAQVRDDVRATMATRNPRPKPGDDIIITALGTGSSMPSKYRNGQSLSCQSLSLG